MLYLEPSDVVRFQDFIRRWYVRHGRHELPWRQTTDPYRVLVSEMMLQQTQVERVVPKYLAFIEQFPDVYALAAVPLSEVLILWQGLGYNRRAKFLHQAAQAVTKQYSGKFPETQQELQMLPGIGAYTAGAIRNFAYALATPLVETNVRSVFLYHFFPTQTTVPDTEIQAVVTQTLDAAQPREWFWALMDYGSHLKRSIGNPNQRSKQHTKQSRFSGSLRQVRGEIIRLLTKQSPMSKEALSFAITGNTVHFPDALQQLLAEKLIVSTTAGFTLAN